MKRSYRKTIRKCNSRITRRLVRKNYQDQPRPVMSGSNIRYEMGKKAHGMSYGGIGAVHQMGGRLGLADEINKRLDLLKVHVPYHESDHVLNIAYNVLLGGV